MISFANHISFPIQEIESFEEYRCPTKNRQKKLHFFQIHGDNVLWRAIDTYQIIYLEFPHPSGTHQP